MRVDVESPFLGEGDFLFCARVGEGGDGLPRICANLFLDCSLWRERLKYERHGKGEKEMQEKFC